MRSLIAVLMTFSVVTAAVAADENGKQTVVELSNEMVECQAYFVVSATCFRDFLDPAAAPGAVRDYMNAADHMGQLALETGNRAGVTADAIRARMNLMTEAMMTSMNKNCANLSILAWQYGRFCKELSTQPEIRLRQITSGHICDAGYRCRE
jgi:hypothetical protein